jgi:hypothetical protein
MLNTTVIPKKVQKYDFKALPAINRSLMLRCPNGGDRTHARNLGVIEKVASTMNDRQYRKKYRTLGRRQIRVRSRVVSVEHRSGIYWGAKSRIFAWLSLWGKFRGLQACGATGSHILPPPNSFVKSFAFRSKIEKEGLPRGSTPALGAGGPEFKSRRPDHSLRSDPSNFSARGQGMGSRLSYEVAVILISLRFRKAGCIVRHCWVHA